VGEARASVALGRLPLARAASTAPRQPPAADVLELLACPITKTRLRYDSEAHELVSDAAGLAFAITEDGIINLMASDARVVRRISGDK